MSADGKRIHVTWYASLREQRGISDESVDTLAGNAAVLFEELAEIHGVHMQRERVRFGVNDRIQPWNTPLQEGDRVAFLPPVAGG
jgi:molybdopterin synthase sulfur carrier subunit